MCGIAGIVLAEPRGGLGGLGAEMMRRLEHRGPDDHGWLCYERGGLRAGQGRPDDGPTQAMLLHRRLSIIDLSAAGRQPMSTADGRYHLVFNGEIYNYIELRAELQAAGQVFHTRTDTEVLLAALAHWGTGALGRLVGMFAFALLDTDTRTLLLARDFFGIKPLYYVRDARRLAFASEIKALLPLPGLRRRVNPEGVYRYLAESSSDYGPDTLLEGVKQLLPGQYLQISLDRPEGAEAQTYWKLTSDERTDLSFDEAARKLREMFLESIRIHMRSDVAVGSALSGGIDSSSIAGAIREVCGRGIEYHTFSFVATDSPLNEEHWGDMAAAAAGTIVHKVRIKPEELLDDLDHLIYSQDQPFSSTSLYAQYRVFRLARETGITVVLDGQGGDELFAGYTGYLYPRLMELLRSGRLVRAMRFARSAAARPTIRWHRLMGRTCAQLLPACLRRPADWWMARRGGWAWLNDAWFREREVTTDGPLGGGVRNGLKPALMEGTVVSSLPKLLRHEDRNSMAFGIESRVPFLTPAIAQFAMSLPAEYLIGEDGTSKRVLRAAMRGIAPDPILARKDKIGFETPELDWLRALRPWVNRVLSSDMARALPVLHHGETLAQAEAILAGARPFDWRVWRWLNLIRWSELFEVEY